MRGASWGAFWRVLAHFGVRRGGLGRGDAGGVGCVVRGGRGVGTVFAMLRGRVVGFRVCTPSALGPGWGGTQLTLLVGRADGARGCAGFRLPHVGPGLRGFSCGGHTDGCRVFSAVPAGVAGGGGRLRVRGLPAGRLLHGRGRPRPGAASLAPVAGFRPRSVVCGWGSCRLPLGEFPVGGLHGRTRRHAVAAVRVRGCCAAPGPCSRRTLTGQNSQLNQHTQNSLPYHEIVIV